MDMHEENLTLEQKIQLDGEVLMAIEEGHHRKTGIEATVQLKMSEQSISDRDVDKALQRLRKAGKISYASTGWKKTP